MANHLKIYLLCLAALVASPASAQNIDSLYTVLLNSKGNDFVHNANALAKAAGDTARFADNTPREEILPRILKTVILYLYDLQQFKDVAQYAELSVPIYEEAGDSLNLAGCYHTAGIAYHHLGLFDKAITSYYKSSDILQAIGGDVSKLRSRYVLNNIGDIYIHTGNYVLAEKLYKQCIEMINNQENDTTNMLDLSNYLNNLAEIYRIQSEDLEGADKQTKINDAITNSEKALALARQYRDEPAKITKRLLTLSTAYIANKEYAKAEKLLNEAQTAADANSLKLLQVEIFAKNAELNSKTGNYSQANIFYDNAIALAEQNGYNQLLEQMTAAAYRLNRDADPARALIFYEKYVALKDSVVNEESMAQLNDFQIKYDVQQKEFEIERQKSEISRSRTRQAVFISGLLVAVLLLALLFYILRLRTRRNRALAERNLALTERSEALAQRSETLAGTNATKDKFFNIISHDLRSPAISLRDAIALLARYASSWNAAQLTDYYNKLLQSADGQVELIYNLLNWAQVQTGRMPFKPVPFDLVAELRNDLSLIRNLADRKGITLVLSLPPSSIVNGDSAMLCTVIRNLLTNAVKFTATGGEMKLAIECTRITVSDTGVGMSPAQLANLFRLDNPLSQKGTAGEAGSGLGLVVCKELIEKHGSALNVESEEGKGTRFWFEISIV
jgi:signal transduction histidine kinase